MEGCRVPFQAFLWKSVILVLGSCAEHAAAARCPRFASLGLSEAEMATSACTGLFITCGVVQLFKDKPCAS